MEILSFLKNTTYVTFLLAFAATTFQIIRFAKLGGCTNCFYVGYSPQKGKRFSCQFSFLLSIALAFLVLTIGSKIFSPHEKIFQNFFLLYVIFVYSATRNYGMPKDQNAPPHNYGRPLRGIEDVG